MPSVSLAPRVARGTAKVAAACLLVMAPTVGQAATFTVNGFTGAFDPSNWDFQSSPNVGSTSGTGTLDSTTLSLTSGTSDVGASAQYSFDTNSISTIYPTFTGGTVTVDWAWAGVTNPAQDPLFSFVGSSTTSGVQLTSCAQSLFPPVTCDDQSDWTLSGTTTFSVVAGQVFGFRITNDGVQGPFTGIGTFTNFNFVGNFTPGPGPVVPVPGPIPFLAVAAGFAWSRKLRRRISMARSVSTSS